MAQRKKRSARRTGATGDERPATSRSKRRADDAPKRRAHTAKHASRQGRGRQDHGARRVISRVVPVASLVVAFVAMVVLYRTVFFASTPDAEQQIVATAPVAAADADQSEAQPEGVEDPWISDGLFSTGDASLDEDIKSFCDALSSSDMGARANAQNVYNTIVWSSYVQRGDDQKPAGPKWARACAKQYFKSAQPEQGIGGEGDYYDFAAAIAFCLSYFGYGDAMAVPVLVSAATGESYGSAYCLVSDEYGTSCLCDPAKGANGWMLDRYSYTILVEDIGQDLTRAEALGLNIQRAPNALTVETGEVAADTDEAAATEEGTSEL